MTQPLRRSTAAELISEKVQTMEIDKQLDELKKEVVEARNLVIKTDNLLKNLHAELKLVGKKQTEFERQHLFTGVTALFIVTALAAGGAYMWAYSERTAARAEAGADSTHIKELGAKVNELNAHDEERAEASEKALGIFKLLATEKEGPARAQAVQAAARLDVKKLTRLEAKAIEDKLASLRAEVAATSYEKGKTAFHRNEFRTAADELQRYVDTVPPAELEHAVYFELGDARYQVKDYEHAVAPLETFIAAGPGQRNADYAALMLGECYQKLGNAAKAIEVYRAGAGANPASQFATMMRGRARKIEQDQANAPAGPAAPPQAAPAPAALGGSAPGAPPKPRVKWRPLHGHR